MRRLLLLPALALVFAPALLRAADTESVDLGGGVNLELVRIKAGKFKQGSPESETGRNADEEQRDVEINADFFIGKFPVTRGQFACFVRDTGYRTEAEVGTSGGSGWDGSALKQRKDFNWRNPGFEQTDQHPVVLVTYADAQAFCRWLEKKANRTISLPSEAQWEYACRAGTSSRYYSGDDAQPGTIGWFKDNAGNGTRAVGGKAPNAWGLYDMSGNVYQWCQDQYEPYRPGGPVQGDQDKKRNVLRGGSWLKAAGSLRSAARYRNTPGSRNADNGFRIVAAEKVVEAVTPPVSGGNMETPSSTLPTNSTDEPRRFVPDTQDATPQPQTSSSPSRFTPTESDDSPGFLIYALMLLIPLSIAGIVTWIIYAIVRSGSSRSSGTSRTLSHVRPRLVDDGFWFDSSGYGAGDLVSYSFRGPDGVVHRNFRIEPSSRGQFIYTGHRPDNLMLGAHTAAHLVSANSYSSSTVRSSTHTQVSRSYEEPTSRGFPSAY